ncbi:porin [Rhodoblastus sphagnicola]|nr:carbohydrate porin [Rhodoblastus sphagnicola]MBB4199591.1 porin [Rhodoblastus sphagnicola]
MAHDLSITGSLMLSLLGASGLPALADNAFTAPAAVLKAPQADSESSAVQLRLQYTGEAWDLSGGTRTKNYTDYMHSLDASLSIDADKLGWRGAHFYFDALGINGKPLTNDAGALSAPSAIDGLAAINTFRLYQAYYEQRIFHTDVLLGIYDPQTQFASTRPMDLFFNRAFAWSTPMTFSGMQGGLNLPLYPNSELGVRIKHEITEQLTAKVGVLNAMADNPTAPWNTDVQFNSKTGALAIGELDYTPIARTKIIAGYWTLTGKFTSADRFNANGTPHQYYGTSGGYVGAATRVYTIDGGRGVDVFANYGFANADVNPVDHSASGGVTVTGLFESRAHDRLGLAIGYLHISRDSFFAKRPFNGDYELPIELTYRAQLTDWLTVQPNIQYIHNPTIITSVTKRDSYLFGLHFELGHLFNL